MLPSVKTPGAGAHPSGYVAGTLEGTHPPEMALRRGVPLEHLPGRRGTVPCAGPVLREQGAGPALQRLPSPRRGGSVERLRTICLPRAHLTEVIDHAEPVLVQAA